MHERCQSAGRARALAGASVISRASAGARSRNRAFARPGCESGGVDGVSLVSRRTPHNRGARSRGAQAARHEIGDEPPVASITIG